MSFTDQKAFDVRCEWGTAGVEALAHCRTFIVIDVFSFSTCVAVAVERGATVLPYYYNDSSATAFAASHQALLAGPRGHTYSLSPRSFLQAPPGTRIVLPSRNGATISLAASRYGNVLAGCFRNRATVCARATALGGPFAVIPGGERWKHDSTLRPALEDLLAAGAMIAMLPGTRSPEAAAAASAFESMRHDLDSSLASCSSGRELAQSGFADDIPVAAALDTAQIAPELLHGMFTASSPS